MSTLRIECAKCHLPLRVSIGPSGYDELCLKVETHTCEDLYVDGWSGVAGGKEKTSTSTEPKGDSK